MRKQLKSVTLEERRDSSSVIITEEVPKVPFPDCAAVTKYSSIDHKIRLAFTLTDAEKDLPIHELYDRIIADEQRNELIFDDLLKALDKGRSPILLTDRTSHLEYFERRLQGFAKNIIVLRGGMRKKQWKQVQEKIRSIPGDQERVMLATERFAGEGFDDARLDTLFLVMPFSWKGTLHQYAGRLHRLYEGKREVQIYDYVDDRVPLFKRMHSKRSSGYTSLGYTVQQSAMDDGRGD